MELFSTVTNTSVTVGATTTEVLAENSTREYALFVNDSDEVIYLALGGDAVLNKGIRLSASGGVFELNSTNMYKGAINAICTSGSKNLCVVEGLD